MTHQHFAHGDMKLKCTATISTVYWKSNEESVQGSGFNAHTATVSESRGRTSGEIQIHVWTSRPVAHCSFGWNYDRSKRRGGQLKLKIQGVQ